GLLMSDDLSMRALSGMLAERARASFAAGCDLALHCNGNMEEMVALASVAPYLEGMALTRFEAALGRLQEPQAFNRGAAEQARLDSLAATA
ncbi:MAG: beta-hexosaminidase, partial [Rhodomicrobium sp.]